jgi:hypothetical protein
MCGLKAFSTLDDRYHYLFRKKEQVGHIEFYKNKNEVNEYEAYLKIAFSLRDQCYYELGYRFNAPLYWCLAQDGNNTKTCRENMKYRK